jgi:hypothetical protein
MERIGRIIAFPGAYVRALGAALLLVGVATPAWWAYLRTRAYIGVKASVTFAGDGPLRPAMLVLPPMPGGKRFAISERSVTYGEFFRVVGDIPINALCGRPLTLDDLETPVVCVSPGEAAYYANLLTDDENRARLVSDRTRITPCYKSAELNAVDMSCTGYRLPTVDEWSFAATLGSVTPNASAPQVQSAPVAGHDSGECRSAAWFIAGMCDALEIAIAAGRDGGPVAMKVYENDIAGSQYGPGVSATFRIARTASETEPF